jgi:8-oxo-dGTP pyrophosphatase MutT (NUDIX family)
MKKFDLSGLKQVLPINPGILRKEEYFNSAVLIPLVEIKGEYHFLFEKRSAEIRQGGEICFPGGEYDSDNDKNFLETAVRETIEELGIKREEIKIIGAIDTLIGPMGVTVDSFIAELKINDLNDLQIDKTEVEKTFTVPVSFFIENPPEIFHVHLEVHPSVIDEQGIKVELLPAKELKLPDKYAIPWGGRKSKVFVYKVNEEVIWGITAALVYEVVEKIKISILDVK